MTASKRIKYLGISLAKEVKDLFTENYWTVMKEIKEDTNKQKDILCSWIRKTNLVKMYHQTSFTRNVKGTSLGEKEKVTIRNWKHENMNGKN